MKAKAMFLVFSLLFCLALSAVAEEVIDATLPGQNKSSIPGSMTRGKASWSDDFNRADGTDMGPDWTEMTGDLGILSNQGVGLTSGNSAMQHVVADGDFDTSTSSVEFYHPTGGLVYVALIAGWGSDNIFVKLQDNNSDGLYDRVFFYHGLNGSSWPGYSPSYYYDLATPTVSGTAILYFTNAGDTANFDVDNGTNVEHFECSGVLGLVPNLGTKFGIGTYNQPAFDNYAVKVGPRFPILDVKVNGGDAGVVVPDTSNTMIDLDVQARDGAGIPCDVWAVLDTPFGYFSYDGIGPYGGWNSGVGHALATGPLADITVTALDRIMPIASYKAYLGIDYIANGRLDQNAIFDVDKCDFEVKVFQGFTEDFNDGIADGWVAGPEFYCTNNLYYLDCPSFQDWLSYYDGFDYVDFTYTAEMRMVVTTSTSTTYDRAIILRCDGTMMNCYEANMDNGGTVSFVNHVNSSGGSTLYTGTSVNMVTGAGSWNQISADARGSNIDVYINGVLDYTVIDTSHVSGKVGLMGGGSGTYDHEYEFDNVTLTL